MLRRKLYSEIKGWLDGPYKDALVIKGARQVGKSYLVEHFLQENCCSALTLDFRKHPDLSTLFTGDLDPKSIVSRMMLHFPDFDFVPNETVLFFDEIQLCPDAWSSLKYFVLDGRYRVIASGSLLGLLHKKAASKAGHGKSTLEAPVSNPVGYERSIEMHSMDFEEFLWAIGVPEDVTSGLKDNVSQRIPYDESVLNDLNRYYSVFMIVGGMPEVVDAYVRTGDMREVGTVQDKILEGYRYDVAKYAPPADIGKINACFDSIPRQLSRDSKKFRYKLIESDLTPAYRTYEGALDWLNDAGIVRYCYNVLAPVEPLDENEMDNQFKLYMRDTGLLVRMLGANVVKSILSGDTRVNRGALAENAVAEGLAKCGIVPRYFSKDSLKIDFIAVLGTNMSAIEVKSGNNRQSKSLDSVKAKYHVKRRIKFEKTNIYSDDDGVEHYPLFVCCFADRLAPEPAIDLSLDTGDFVKRYRAEKASDKISERSDPRAGQPDRTAGCVLEYPNPSGPLSMTSTRVFGVFTKKLIPISTTFPGIPS